MMVFTQPALPAPKTTPDFPHHDKTLLQLDGMALAVVEGYRFNGVELL